MKILAYLSVDMHLQFYDFLFERSNNAFAILMIFVKDNQLIDVTKSELEGVVKRKSEKAVDDGNFNHFATHC